MCAAILFGKVNRVQCHANVVFCNAACLLYETEAESFISSYRSDSDDDLDEILDEDEPPTLGRAPRASFMAQLQKASQFSFLMIVHYHVLHSLTLMPL